jgi:hypothetical protein
LSVPSVPVPKTLPRRIAAFVAAAIVLVLVASQIFLPGIGEGVIEDRLTENGGVADASLSAMPAARLLWGAGDRIAVDATGLDLEVSTSRDPVVFDDLDRFDDVEIVIRDSSFGPVEMDDFVLARQGDEPYSLEGTGTTSVSDLAEFGAESFDLPGADIVGGILNVATGGTEVDVDLDMRLESDDGRVHVLEGGGEIAGIPTGPLATFITSAVTIEL